jgi:protein-tyrosine-phosphatase/DNA-binding transcriptional ArsR family regulator
MESSIATHLATLGHPQRLSVFRLLMRRYPDALPAGEIAAVLGLKASTLSSYLAALMQAGLVTQARQGTSLRYAPDMNAVQGMFAYLLNDCCRGRPDLCPPFSSRSPRGGGAMTQTPKPYRALFICTGNSARSIFAETLLRELGGARFEVHSAGTKPRSELNPFALQVLRDKGHDISGLRAKHVAEFQGPDAPAFDFVFTVCDRAANEECPPWPGQPVSGHWGMPDPVQAEGTEAERALAFQEVYGALRNRVQAFVALPFEALDALSLQRAVDEIGQMKDPVTQ